MKKPVRLGALACVFLGLVMAATPASAQDVSFGYQFQRLFGDGEGVNFPLGFNVDASGPIGSDLSVVGQFDWSRKSESGSVLGTSFDASANVSTFGGGIRWNRNVVGPAPFVHVLAGAAHFSGSGSVAGVNVIDESGTDFMMQFGGGIFMKLGEGWGVVGQGDYRRIFSDEGGNSFRIVGGLRLTFD